MATAVQSGATVAGLTHASTVIPLVSLRSVLSATVTQALDPLKESALPYIPAEFQVALEMTPFRALPALSPSVVPVPSLKP